MLKLFIASVSLILSAQTLAINIAPEKEKKEGITIKSTFDKKRFYVVKFDLFKDAHVKIKPQKVLYPTTNYRIESNYNLTLTSTIKTAEYEEFIISAYDINNKPIQILPDELNLYFMGKSKKFEYIKMVDSNRTLAYQFLLDNSGSMSGERLDKLKRVVNNFMAKYVQPNSECRITLYNHSYQNLTDTLTKCSDYKNGLPLITSSGGTDIKPSLINSTKYFATLPNTHEKVFVIVSDGYDDSTEAELKQIMSNDPTVKTFVYLIDNTDYNYTIKSISDYLAFNDNNFQKVLNTYLASMTDLYNKKFIIRVKH